MSQSVFVVCVLPSLIRTKPVAGPWANSALYRSDSIAKTCAAHLTLTSVLEIKVLERMLFDIFDLIFNKTSICAELIRVSCQPVNEPHNGHFLVIMLSFILYWKYKNVYKHGRQSYNSSANGIQNVSLQKSAIYCREGTRSINSRCCQFLALCTWRW